MKRIEYVLDTAAAVAIVTLCILIVANIATREILKTGVPDIIIAVQELMVPAILFPLASATAARAHIAIEVIASHFPAGVNRWIAVLAAFIGVFLGAVLLTAGWFEFWKAFNSHAHYGGTYHWPKWPSRFLFVLAFLFFLIRLVQILWVDTRAALTGQPAPEKL
ncbi:TRAP transporter small permease [Pseudooceanicola sp. LIPI14-2-Ac024]|uniref:TRAP transporter small permease n=1 Tax=Pseudooceanicola sp. LIPI14-2-Ac024 TaxID=3344875 RepID=UPI0035CF2BB0